MNTSSNAFFSKSNREEIFSPLPVVDIIDELLVDTESGDLIGDLEEAIKDITNTEEESAPEETKSDSILDKIKKFLKI